MRARSVVARRTFIPLLELVVADETFVVAPGVAVERNVFQAAGEQHLHYGIERAGRHLKMAEKGNADI
jgi:hypothetical protein